MSNQKKQGNMSLSPSQKRMARSAAIIGFLQGLAYSGLSVISIGCQSESPWAFPKSSSYMTFVNIMLRNFYLYKPPQGTEDDVVDRSLTAKDFTIIVWFYFVFSVALTVVSVALSFAIHRNKDRQCKLMVLWGLITGGTSIIDLVITSLLLSDYGNCPSFSNDTYELSLICHTLVGIVMTLTARGFTLWIVNVFLTYTMITNGVQIIFNKKVNNAMQDISIPPSSTPNLWSSGPPSGQFPSFQNRPSRSSTFQNGPNQSSPFHNPPNRRF